MHAASQPGATWPTPPLETPRLLLVAVTPAMVARDQQRDYSRLASEAGLTIPATWPPEHWDYDALGWLLRRMDASPQFAGWCRYIARKASGSNILIGTCGCVGPPEETDDVEIGYSVLPQFQRQGYATEAVDALLQWVFRLPHVRSVNAQTFPHLAGSLGVLRKLGFVPAGEGAEPGAVRLRLMRR